MRYGVSMARHLMCELACTVGADSKLCGTAHDHPHALVEDVLVQSRCDNSPDAIVHAGYLQGTHPVCSEIPGWMYANPDPFRLVESRYNHKRISFLSALSSVTVLKKGSAILCVACGFSKCTIQCIPLSTCEHRCTGAGESKAWTCMVYLKNPLWCIVAQRRWSLGSCAI